MATFKGGMNMTFQDLLKTEGPFAIFRTRAFP